VGNRVKTQVESQGGVESRSQGKDQGESSAKSRSRSQGGSRIESQGGARSRQSGVKQPACQGDVDETLVGKRVSIAVSVGNKVARVVGTITVMGRFWVIVDIESSEIESLRGVAYLNKGSIIAYIPLPDNNPDTNHDSNPGLNPKP